jgi:hypothetical protein
MNASTNTAGAGQHDKDDGNNDGGWQAPDKSFHERLFKVSNYLEIEG